jgi:hypothetical protein
MDLEYRDVVHRSEDIGLSEEKINEDELKIRCEACRIKNDDFRRGLPLTAVRPTDMSQEATQDIDEREKLQMMIPVRSPIETMSIDRIAHQSRPRGHPLCRTANSFQPNRSISDPQLTMSIRETRIQATGLYCHGKKLPRSRSTLGHEIGLSARATKTSKAFDVNADGMERNRKW